MNYSELIESFTSNVIDKAKKKTNKEKRDIVSDYVDLGLPSGNLWCKCNVGAKSETEVGEFFTQERAIHYKNDTYTLPSKDDFLELSRYCDHDFKVVDGVPGHIFISKENGNTLFFPQTGLISFIIPGEERLTNDEMGVYWTSSRLGNSYSQGLAFEFFTKASPSTLKSLTIQAYIDRYKCNIKMLKKKDKNKKIIKESFTSTVLKNANSKKEEIKTKLSYFDNIEDVCQYIIDHCQKSTIIGDKEPRDTVGLRYMMLYVPNPKAKSLMDYPKFYVGLKKNKETGEIEDEHIEIWSDVKEFNLFIENEHHDLVYKERTDSILPMFGNKDIEKGIKGDIVQLVIDYINDHYSKDVNESFTSKVIKNRDKIKNDIKNSISYLDSEMKIANYLMKGLHDDNIHIEIKESGIITLSFKIGADHIRQYNNWISIGHPRGYKDEFDNKLTIWSGNDRFIDFMINTYPEYIVHRNLRSLVIGNPEIKNGITIRLLDIIIDFFNELIDDANVNESFTSKVIDKAKNITQEDKRNIVTDYVDLGLPSGTLWCSHNYGVNNEYEPGNQYNHVDAVELDLSPGQLPSTYDFTELKEYCDREITEVNGVKGLMFTSKTNSNKLFFPVAKNYERLEFFTASNYGYYWSSEIYDNDGAYNMKFDLSSKAYREGILNTHNTSYRKYGFLVRCVQKRNKIKESFTSNVIKNADKIKDDIKNQITLFDSIDKISEYFITNCHTAIKQEKFPTGNHILHFEDIQGPERSYVAIGFPGGKDNKNHGLWKDVSNDIVIWSNIKELDNVIEEKYHQYVLKEKTGVSKMVVGDPDHLNGLPVSLVNVYVDHINEIVRREKQKKVNESFTSKVIKDTRNKTKEDKIELATKIDIDIFNKNMQTLFNSLGIRYEKMFDYKSKDEYEANTYGVSQFDFSKIDVVDMRGDSLIYKYCFYEANESNDFPLYPIGVIWILCTKLEKTTINVTCNFSDRFTASKIIGIFHDEPATYKSLQKVAKIITDIYINQEEISNKITSQYKELKDKDVFFKNNPMFIKNNSGPDGIREEYVNIIKEYCKDFDVKVIN